MPSETLRFCDLEDELSDVETARAVILPVPLERTVSYGRGTARGPNAILRASQYLELYDEELGRDLLGHGVATLAPLLPLELDLEKVLKRIELGARRWLENGKFLVTLGGEHSLTIAPVRAARALWGEDLGVVQFDAHADLRDEYEGAPYSHACVMRRVLEESLPTLAVGLRSLSEPEARLIRERRLPVIWASELGSCRERFAELLDALPGRVYLTFDVDYFDPAMMPSTGTPEPGGGRWWPTLELLRALFERKRVVAMDVVELAPRAGHRASDFAAAKLVLKALGYRFELGRDDGGEPWPRPRV